MAKKSEQWLNENGVTLAKYESEFDALQNDLVELFTPLFKRMPARELYMITMLASASAVGDLVRARANARDMKTRKKR